MLTPSRLGRIVGEEEVPHKDFRVVECTGIEKDHLVADPWSVVDAGQDNVDAVVRHFVPKQRGSQEGGPGLGARRVHSPEASPRLRAGLGAWEKDDVCVIPRTRAPGDESVWAPGRRTTRQHVQDHPRGDPRGRLQRQDQGTWPAQVYEAGGGEGVVGPVSEKRWIRFRS